MKVNVEVDCTPQEARQFLGLPDVQPMQDAVMDRLQQQMVSNIEKVSPEALMQSWFNFNPKITEQFQDMFVAMAGLGSPRSGYATSNETTASELRRRHGLASRQGRLIHEPGMTRGGPCANASNGLDRRRLRPIDANGSPVDLSVTLTV